jgi:hypothetical protein
MFELGKRPPYDRSLDDLRDALVAAGVEFTKWRSAGCQDEEGRDVSQIVIEAETLFGWVTPPASGAVRPS